MKLKLVLLIGVIAIASACVFYIKQNHSQVEVSENSPKLQNEILKNKTNSDTSSSSALSILAGNLFNGNAKVKVSDLKLDNSITYRLVDLNSDGQDEIITMIKDEQCKSNAGCKFGIFEITDGYVGSRLTSVNASSELPKIDTIKTNGYFDLTFGPDNNGKSITWKWSGSEYK